MTRLLMYVAYSLFVFCRLGHDTKHFNVGQYRRVQKGDEEVQDASFFDPNNEVGAQIYCHHCNVGQAFCLLNIFGDQGYSRAQMAQELYREDESFLCQKMKISE